MGTDFVEPLTLAKPKADYVDSDGLLHTDINDRIKEAFERFE